MIRPFVMGAAMAAMMLAMLHEKIMSGEGGLTAGAVLFGLAHVVVVALVLAAALVLPGLRHRLRAHRPRAAHLAGMVAGMLVAAGAIHAVMHGVVI